MSLPMPPEKWLEANGYSGWLSDRRRREASSHFAYERDYGPATDFPEGTRAYEQWTYKGGDPFEIATTREEVA